MKEELRHGVVGDEKIDPSILVVVRDGYSKRLGRLVEPQFVRDLSKVTIAIIVIYQHRDRLKHIRMAVAPIAFAMLAAP